MPNNYDPPHGGNGGYDNDKDKNNLQAQLEAQAQAQGELQAQGQGQGEWQGQSQHQDSENFNGNLNCNSNGNENCNVNANYNTSHTEVCVDVKVDASICETPQAPSAPDIDLSCLNISGNVGIVNLMPENSTQYISDSGGSDANNVIFHLDQVNNLINNNTLTASTGPSSMGNFGSLTGGNPTGHVGDGASGLNGSEVTSSMDHAGAASVDGISQSITMGANIQLNTSTFAGHDSVIADHNSAGHDSHV
ncbi:MAG TPA: hypothetical protein VH558_16910 [Pseudolabrys sp.]|jgi:hypothetical protein